eukprot:g2002.t1
MGLRSCYYAGFYGWIAVVSIVCMAMGFDIYFKGGQDCVYDCPLLTLDAAAMNQLLADANVGFTYDTEFQSLMPCTSNLGFCFKKLKDGETNVYQNTCVDPSTFTATDPTSLQTAFNERCIYCDSAGIVYWPALKATSSNQWIPTEDCGTRYTNAGLTGSDVGTPQYNTIQYTNTSGSSVYIDISSMGTTYFSQNSQDLTHYPYCEGENSIGWQKSAIDLKASETVLMLLLLCIYYCIMAFFCMCIAATFYHFSKYEKDDWAKLKSCERWFACLVKQMQLVIRLANTVSLIFVVILFYNIWVLGVCKQKGDPNGVKRFYPAIEGYTMFVLITYGLHCFGGCFFRRKIAMETAFYTPRHVFHPKERMACMDYVKKYWICVCKYYNIFGGP